MTGERDAATLRRRLRCALAGLLLLAACGDDPVDPDPACDDVPPLDLGETRAGILGVGDALFDGSFIDYYAIHPPAGGTLVVEMAAEVPVTSDGVDPFLYLWSEDLGDPLDQAYDSTGQGPLLRVARLPFVVSPGCYRIGASGWPSADEGSYTVRADLIPGT